MTTIFRSSLRSISLILVLAATLMSSAAFAKLDIETEVFDQDGYIRLVFNWPDRPRATAEIENGVLVIYFEDAFKTDLKYLRDKLKPYVSRVRQDKQSKTLRLALKGELKLFTSIVDNQLALDLLPLYWRDAPPAFYGTAPDLDVVERSIAALGNEAAERFKITTFSPPDPYLALDVRLGERDEFTRIVFEWPEPVEYDLMESDGSVTLVFDKNARPKLSRFRVDPPKFVLGADYKNKLKNLHVEFLIEPDVEIKHFRDGTKVALDIWPKKRVLDSVAAKAPHDNAHKDAHKDAHADSHHDEEHHGDHTAHATGDVTHAEKTAQAHASGHGPEGHEKHSAPDIQVAAPRQHVEVPKSHATNDADFHLKKEKPADTASDPLADDLADHEVAAPSARRAAAPADGNMVAFRVDVVALPDQTRLKFPWPKEVEAAVFRRGDHVWIVFSEEAAIDLSAIDRRVRQHVAQISDIPVPQATALRLLVPEGAYASVDTVDNDWIVTIAEEKRTPRGGVPITSFSATPENRKVALGLGSPSTVYWVRDPEIGDDIAVVTASPAVRGIPVTRNYVDFSLLSSAHGVVVQSTVDDLFVGLDPDGNVIVRSLSGLSLSTPDRTVWGTGESILKYVSRPAFVDVEEWKTSLDFASRRHELQLAVSVANGPELEAARFDLAKFYIANQLPTEALGILTLIETDNASSENTAAIRAMRGIASLMLGRTKDAERDLEHRLLENDRDAAVWQGLAAYRLGRDKRATERFERSKPVLEEYPEEWQRRFILAAANAALDLDDQKVARDYLSLLPKDENGKIDDPESQWVTARTLEAEGNTDAAIEMYEVAANSSHLPTSVRAQFDSTRLLTKVGSITEDEAIDRLDGLRFQWRGDALELAILSELGNRMIGQDRYREGFAVLRTAVTHYPDERLARDVTDDMAEAFEALYLAGEADNLPPIQALALFYDYRELTPIGRRGDDMIRRLAERLADVDLLEQAADLLDHQVQNRLHGVAKAQVAARLAMVYLQDRKPEAALQTIRETRQGRLPNILINQRRLIEARALADLGFGEKAMDLLTEDTTLEARRLKADINWQIGEYRTAARAYEKLLGPRWQKYDPLSTSERLDVMRAAIGYSLEGDEFALARVRERYLGVMSESVDASAFDVVTQGTNVGALEFKELVKAIANTSTLDAFIRDVKKRYDNQNLSALN